MHSTLATWCVRLKDIVGSAITVTVKSETPESCSRSQITLDFKEAEALFAFFTVGLIVLGLVTQLTRQHDGGKTARAAPCVTVILLIVIVVFGERFGILANREGIGALAGAAGVTTSDGSLPDLSSTLAGQRNVTGLAALQAELARLQAVLKQAVADEDYAKAAELKPKIKQLKATAREPGALRTPGSGGKRKGSRRNRKPAPGATSVAADAATMSGVSAVATASAAVASATTVDTATTGVGAAGAVAAGSVIMGDSESGKGRKRGGAPEGDESSGKKRGRRGRRSGTARASTTSTTSSR